MDMLHFASVLLLVVDNPLRYRYTLGKEVLIFTVPEIAQSPSTLSISVAFLKQGPPQKFPTRVTGQCHDKRARERGSGPGNGKEQD